MSINTATATKADLEAASTEELIETYNKITGKNIKAFHTRAKGLAQVWNAMQQLGPDEDVNQTVKEESKPAAKKAEPKPTKKAARAEPKEDGKRAEYESRVIRVLVKENPKRKGTRAWTKFAALMKCDGKTIHDYRNEEGKHPSLDDEKHWPSGELRWCIGKGFIKILETRKKIPAAA